MACYRGFVELSRGQWGAVGSFAVRIAHFAECVAEAHGLGHGPGDSRKPWGIRFQQRTCSIYAQTLSAEYLRGVADASGHCAGVMEQADPEDEVAADWEIVAQFLRSTAVALGEMPAVAAVAGDAGTAEIASTSPPVLRYELFAELLHPRGAVRLRKAAAAVARCCESHVRVVPTARELEWLISVSAGVPVADLAKCNETSVRGMYRRLEKTWERLGVANQVQGVALAVQEGWIAPLPSGEGEG